MVTNMKKLFISLKSIEQVKSFVNDLIYFDYPMDLSSERYIVNAKSILGLFSLDLTKPLELTIHAGDNEDLTDLLEALKPYMDKTAENT